MLDFFKNLVAMRRDRNEAGASAVEYGLLVAGIAAVVVTIVFLLGGQIQSAFDTTCDKVKQGSSATAANC